VEPGKKQRKKEQNVGKARVEPPTIGIAAVTPNHSLHHKQDSVFLTKKWPISLYCVMPRDRMLDWRHNSSSRSVAISIWVV